MLTKLSLLGLFFYICSCSYENQKKKEKENILRCSGDIKSAKIRKKNQSHRMVYRQPYLLLMIEGTNVDEKSNHRKKKQGKLDTIIKYKAEGERGRG